jgi:hypothetical protein
MRGVRVRVRVQGYPRGDIDVHAVRNDRHRLAGASAPRARGVAAHSVRFAVCVF